MALHPQAQAVLDAMAALGDPPIHADTVAAPRATTSTRRDGEAALTAAGGALAAALA